MSVMGMDIFRIFLYAGLFIGILAYLIAKLIYYFDEKRERKMEENQKQQQEEAGVLATRNLLMSTLREMGCQPEIDEEGDVRFQYQGRFFYCCLEKNVINIVYPCWEKFDIRSIDINDIYTTINKIHLSKNIWCRIICTVEENTVSLMSVYSTVFISEIPFLKDLLEASLQDFFITQRVFELEFQELKQ